MTNTASRGFPRVSAIAHLAEAGPALPEPHWSFDDRAHSASLAAASRLRRETRRALRLEALAACV